MRKQKRMMAGFLAAVLLLAAIGCGSKEPEETSKSSGGRFSGESYSERTKEEETAEALPEEDIPFVGMNEKYLNDTELGIAYFHGRNHVSGKVVADIYYYYDDYDAVIFALRVVDGRVYDVSDYRDHPWVMPKVYKDNPYDPEGKLKYQSESSEEAAEETTAAKPPTTTLPSKVRPDPYAAFEYYDADDFAEDWEEEFEDYDEAFEYWEDVMYEYQRNTTFSKKFSIFAIRVNDTLYLLNGNAEITGEEPRMVGEIESFVPEYRIPSVNGQANINDLGVIEYSKADGDSIIVKIKNEYFSFVTMEEFGFEEPKLAYSLKEDGTWECQGYTYQYCYLFCGKRKCSTDYNTFIVLSNREDITAEMAAKQLYSRNYDDLFYPKQSILVDYY